MCLYAKGDKCFLDACKEASEEECEHAVLLLSWGFASDPAAVRETHAGIVTAGLEWSTDYFVTLNTFQMISDFYKSLYMGMI